MFYGKCDKCGESGSLDPIMIDETNEAKKYCFICCQEYWSGKDLVPDTNKRDPDDERKYGRY